MTMKIVSGNGTVDTAQESKHGDGWVIAVGIPELAERTGLSEGLLYAKANQGTLHGCRRVGKRFLVHIATFEQWLAEGWGEGVEE